MGDCGVIAKVHIEQRGGGNQGATNSGAVELSQDRKSCHHSLASCAPRRYFKVRELAAEGLVHVEHVPTADNSADVPTKVLGVDSFLKHVGTVMNLPLENKPVEAVCGCDLLALAARVVSSFGTFATINVLSSFFEASLDFGCQSLRFALVRGVYCCLYSSLWSTDRPISSIISE